ncbi:hypothetical protein PoB_003039100 [Plakobranchus ocellatus]|uniref:Uncharacterized protein n=1 Tax=Plakobranchus ocellatus TaxID=259542 RepID=A0AAV4AB70_9GAST|nr:hypothetical protein PoB_003039100 [Plakobranchus ocellatus]
MFKASTRDSDLKTLNSSKENLQSQPVLHHQKLNVNLCCIPRTCSPNLYCIPSMCNLNLSCITRTDMFKTPL